jgi:tellurite resistance protein
MGILDTIFKTSSSSEDDKYVLYLWAAINVATVDGVADEEEENKIYEFFLSDLGFSTERYDKIRNRADREGTQIFSKAKNLNDDDKMELMNFLVDIATSDGHFHGEELIYIVGIGMLLELNYVKLYNHLTENFEIDPDEVKIASERIKKNMNQ